MKIKTKEMQVRNNWKLEEGMSVTAGTSNIETFIKRTKIQRKSERNKRPKPDSAFSANILGKLINLARRERSKSLDQLAQELEISSMELYSIEEGRKLPESQVISKLGKVIGIPEKRLLELAGFLENIDESFAKAAKTFGSKVNSQPLSVQEKRALYDFERVLSEFNHEKEN